MGNHNAKDSCCGQYPNRLPYDSLNRECCRKTEFNDFGDFFEVDEIVPLNTCGDRAGEVLDGGTPLL